MRASIQVNILRKQYVGPAANNADLFRRKKKG